MESWLDRAEWNPRLRCDDIATLVADAIDYRHRRGDWHVYEYVIMPTHVHLFCELGSAGMKTVLEDFKRWTGHRAAEQIAMQRSDTANGAPRFWQREWFDHWSRSDDEDDRIIAYIQNNPIKGNLVANHNDWPHASWSRK
jgi:REP element-mobilizing transposase RayT